MSSRFSPSLLAYLSGRSLAPGARLDDGEVAAPLSRAPMVDKTHAPPVAKQPLVGHISQSFLLQLAEAHFGVSGLASRLPCRGGRQHRRPRHRRRQFLHRQKQPLVGLNFWNLVSLADFLGNIVVTSFSCKSPTM